jgi:hypothetical protein
VLIPGCKGLDVEQAPRCIGSDEVVTPYDDSRLRLNRECCAGAKQRAKERPQTFLYDERFLALKPGEISVGS